MFSESKKRKTAIGYALAGLVGASLLLLGSNAHAQYYLDQHREYHDGDSSGNGNFSAYYIWDGDTRNTASSNTSNKRESAAWQQFGAGATVLGASLEAVYAEAGAESFLSSNGSYQKVQWGTVRFAGQDIFNQTVWNTTCPGQGASYGCTSYSNSLSKTLFSAGPIAFTIGPVPVFVSASVKGSISGGLSATTYSASYIGKSDSLYGRSTAGLTAGAYVSSDNYAEVGIPYVVSIGAGLHFKLIDVSISPTMYAKEAVYPSGGVVKGTRLYNNVEPVTINTMSGSVDVFAKLFGATIASKTLISWSGYTYSDTWINDSASETL